MLPGIQYKKFSCCVRNWCTGQGKSAVSLAIFDQLNFMTTGAAHLFQETFKIEETKYPVNSN